MVANANPVTVDIELWQRRKGTCIAMAIAHVTRRKTTTTQSRLHRTASPAATPNTASYKPAANKIIEI